MTPREGDRAGREKGVLGAGGHSGHPAALLQGLLLARPMQNDPNGKPLLKRVRSWQAAREGVGARYPYSQLPSSLPPRFQSRAPLHPGSPMGKQPQRGPEEGLPAADTELSESHSHTATDSP